MTHLASGCTGRFESTTVLITWVDKLAFQSPCNESHERQLSHNTALLLQQPILPALKTAVRSLQ
jgi:hypothetical protein